jgi:hypothetical protein
MAQISRFLRSCEGGGLLYWCQGCDMLHQVKVGEGPGPRWGYNGNPDKPTFTPSVLTQFDHWVPPASPGWTPVPQTKVSSICHTFITDGIVQFLGDCTHALAGQTLPLPELPDYLQGGGES